jgi:membrane protease YdiL (CAAX protease family)
MLGAAICFPADWNTPLAICSYFALIMAIFSLWVKKTPWLWGTFLGLSFFFGFSSVIDPVALIPIFALLLMYLALTKLTGKKRVLVVFLAAALSSALFFHLLPGFHNWKIAEHLCLGINAVPYNFWMTYDKPFGGFFILAFLLPLLQTNSDLKRVTKAAIPISILGILVILLLSLYWKVVQYDPKFPAISWLWPIVNLFFVVVPEEALFRGFIQEEIFKSLGGKGSLANVSCVILASLLFALFHLLWIASFPFISLVFIAGIVFGTVYQYTRAIEGSIFCHFFLNVIHFFFFTYPALQK